MKVGTADPPLAPLGLRQARAVAGFLADEPDRAIVSSPLLRAQETAAPLAEALGRPIELVDDLGEHDSGQQSYVPVHEIRETHAEMWQQMLRGDLPEFVDVEAFRVASPARSNGSWRPTQGRGAVAVFCHAGFINVALGGYIGIPRALPFVIDYTGISRITASRSGRCAVISFNETAHVRLLLDVEGASAR